MQQRTVLLSSFNYASMHHDDIAYSTYFIGAGATKRSVCGGDEPQPATDVLVKA